MVSLQSNSHLQTLVKPCALGHLSIVTGGNVNTPWPCITSRYYSADDFSDLFMDSVFSQACDDEHSDTDSRERLPISSVCALSLSLALSHFCVFVSYFVSAL